MVLRQTLILIESYPGDESYQNHLQQISGTKHFQKLVVCMLPDGSEETVFFSSVGSKNDIVEQAEKILKEGAKTIIWNQAETTPAPVVAAKSSKIAALIKSILRH